ncbi:MAG: CotH kinase family protein [Verrucomicrobiales bacterium]
MKRWGVHSGRTVVYARERWFVADSWDKTTNGSEDDWSDLQRFVEVMHHASGDAYLEQVREVGDTGQWIRWFAIMTLLNNNDTNLSNGIDDDYAMIADGDGRFQFLPHDLDSLFSLSPQASLFPMIDGSVGGSGARIPQLIPFFEEPEILRAYFSELQDLLETVFSKPTFDRLVTSALAGTSFENRARNMISSMDQRRAFVLEHIQAPLAFGETAVPEGALENQLTVTGTGGFIDGVRISVNGQKATVDGLHGTWRVQNVALSPSTNTLVLRSYDAAGQITQEVTRQIQFDTGMTPKELSGDLAEDTVLAAEDGPYWIIGDLTVPVQGFD